MGYLEYDIDMFFQEYERDIERNFLNVEVFKYYFVFGGKEFVNCWKVYVMLLFMNWLNYYVYQEILYEWD